MTRPKEAILDDIIVAIDGPAGSGKTTTAREVARRLGLIHVDTGAMYRAVTLKAIREGLDPSDGVRIGALADSARVQFVEDASGARRVMLDGFDVTDEIRTSRVTDAVSAVSAHASVRRAMVRKQRSLANHGGVCIEGRDIGSVVVPGAHVKIYLDASPRVRAERRMLEFEAKGGAPRSLDDVQRDIEDRDRKDRTRDVSPLKVPVGAHLIDTSAIDVETQVVEVVSVVRRVAGHLAALRAPRGRPNPFARRRFVWNVAHFFLKFLFTLLWGLRTMRKQGEDGVENYIYASNHRSNLDPPMIGASLDRELYFLAKESLFRQRAFGWLIATFNAMPIKRGRFDRPAMDRCIGLLEEGKNVLIFPEGGRVKGEELGSAKPGVGYLALKSGRPVVPVYVEGTNRLRRAFFRRPPITVVHGRPIRLTDPDLSRLQDAEKFRDFGHMVMAAIGALRDELMRGES